MPEEWLKSNDLAVAVFAAAFMFLALRMLPRLMAGVPFAKPAELKQRLDRREDVLVVDVRGADEFMGDLGHIAGSLNLPLPNLAGRLTEMKEALSEYADTPVYVVCRTANRAATAARQLKKAGLRDIRVVDGGMVRWKREGLPTTRVA
ncbi:rhodanese-like domain-containing protein [Novispirillum sp. DQ9]|uniref:rhodanese-like domain-containing protein n=1 Tax=Novispirillum sp. DQ9 TaxID=3398612 RepID=UPI003C7CBA74